MHQRLRLFIRSAVALAVILGLGGCAGGSTEPGGIDISGGTYHLSLVAYVVPKVGFDGIIPAFHDIRSGHNRRN